MNIVEIKKLGFYYNQSKVLSDLDLCVKRGDFIVLLGDSGCGKSTLLKIISGILKQQEGEIINHAKGVALFFQNPPLYPWLNLLDNVSFGLRLGKKSKEEIYAQAKHLLKSVGLEGEIFAKKYPYACSGGQKSRAYLAKILADNKELILLDEPFGALDTFSKENMQNLVRNIWETHKKTMVLITHDVDEALRLGTRIFILKPLTKSPINIVAEFQSNFTYKIGVDSNIEFQHDYIVLKEKMLEILKANADNYVI